MQTLADAKYSMPKITKRAAGRKVIGLRQSLVVQTKKEYGMHATISWIVWRVDRNERGARFTTAWCWLMTERLGWEPKKTNSSYNELQIVQNADEKERDNNLEATVYTTLYTQIMSIRGGDSS